MFSIQIVVTRPQSLQTVGLQLTILQICTFLDMKAVFLLLIYVASFYQEPADQCSQKLQFLPLLHDCDLLSEFCIYVTAPTNQNTHFRHMSPVQDMYHTHVFQVYCCFLMMYSMKTVHYIANSSYSAPIASVEIPLVKSNHLCSTGTMDRDYEIMEPEISIAGQSI